MAIQYEAVIGMEIHAELATQSKMFCGCEKVDFTTAEPNIAICPVCTGQPGAMPVMNQTAIEMAMKVGLALNCDINPTSVFARKNYYYPDLPKGYQISQYELPLASHGWIDIDVEGETKRVRVTRAHMEEDTAKLSHAGGGGWSDPYSLIDFNRSGVPLLEIVSEPDMHTPEEAHAYGTAIREVLRYLGVNSGDMQKGILRFEANVSVRPVGSDVLNTRTEIKNLNSFRALSQSVAYEIERQIDVTESGGKIVQETLGWDEERGVTFSQRSKEDAHDYRYFPEPDLPPLFVDEAWISEVRESLPELPSAKTQRFIDDFDVKPQDARTLVQEPAVAAFFDAAVAAYEGKPANVANWIVGDLFFLMRSAELDIHTIKISPADLVALLSLIDKKTINRNRGRDVLAEMLESGKAPMAIVEAHGWAQISDSNALEQAVDKVLDANPGQVATYLGGKESIIGWFVGQIMRETRGRANPQMVRELLVKQLESRR